MLVDQTRKNRQPGGVDHRVGVDRLIGDRRDSAAADTDVDVLDVPSWQDDLPVHERNVMERHLRERTTGVASWSIGHIS